MNTAPETKPVLPALVSGGAIRAIIPQTFEEAWRIANAISKAGMQPPGLETPEKVTIAIMAGLEVGLPPMQAIQSIAVINNRPSIYGDGPIALVRASGLLVEMKEEIKGGEDKTFAVCTVRRRGENTDTVRTFSVADAKKAGLWSRKGPWEHYPQRMLAMRARAFALRDAFADVLRGLAIAEEQADIKPALPQPPAPPPDDHIPDFGANVVEQAAGDRPDDAGATGSGEAPTSPQPPSAAATQFKESVNLGNRAEAIAKILALASDPDVVEEQERLENLDGAHAHWREHLDPDFHRELFSMASKVAKRQLTVGAADKYLKGL